MLVTCLNPILPVGGGGGGLLGPPKKNFKNSRTSADNKLIFGDFPKI